MNYNRNIATFYLILMCIQIIPIEGIEASMVKFGAMCYAPILLFKTSQMTKAMVWGGLYFICILLSTLYHLETFRFTKIGYILMAVISFITFYNLVHCNKAFTADYFISLIKRIIMAYIAVALIQQLARITFVGYHSFPLINLVTTSKHTLTANSLSVEPSHFARILSALFLSLLRMYQCKWGKEHVTLKVIYQDFKWGSVGFLWCMLTMGSSTALVALGITSLFFVRKRVTVIVIAFIIAGYQVIPYINFKPLQRIHASIEATLTMDTQNIKDADLSASARILPYLYTIKHFDIFNTETWVGSGTDTGVNNNRWGLKRMIGGISDFGFLSYIFALFLVFSCCIRRFFSVETLFFIVLLMAETRNVYVWWAVFMLFATTNYFLTNTQNSPKVVTD